MSPRYVSEPLLHELLALLDEVEIRGTLFVVPQSLSSTREDRYNQVLREASRKGHELALHGYSHAKNEFGFVVPIPLPRLDRQKELLRNGLDRFSNCLGVRPSGFRAPGYKHSKVTLRALADLGFRYDSSRTVFKPAASHFRLKTRTGPKLGRVGSIYEIPVIGDYAFNLLPGNFEQCLKRAVEDFHWAERLDGIFVVTHHINRATSIGLKFLSTLIHELRGKTDFLTLTELTRQP